jgi:hypothetical protein
MGDIIKRNLGIAAAVIAAAAALAAYIYFPGWQSAAAENAARAAVQGFGAQLQKVAPLAANASSTIAVDYGPYVAPALLAAWEADPSDAPGRTISNPLPNRIEVVSMTPQSSGYIVQAAIILAASNTAAHSGNADFTPVMLQVVPEGGKWLIAAYQEQKITGPKK